MAVLVKIPYYVQAPVHQKNPEAKPLSPFWLPLVPEDRSILDRYDVYIARKDVEHAFPTGTIFESFTVAPYTFDGQDVDAIQTKTNEGIEVLKHLVHLDWNSASLVIRPPRRSNSSDAYQKRHQAFLNATADAVADETS